MTHSHRFKSALLASALCLLTTALCLPPAGAEVPRLIFDSDMSSDWDDVGDIAVLHGLASMGECEIIGMFNSSTNGSTMFCMDAINTFYGKPDIPIGRRPDIGGMGGYPALIANEFPHGPEKSPQDFPVAVDLYRKLLAASPDKSVIIATTGYLNNLEALLKSGPDAISPLNGEELVKKKVQVWACAGGEFPGGSEFNFAVGAASAYYVVNHWPTAVTYTPFDVGGGILTCGRMPQLPSNNPIRRVYVEIEKTFPYPSWGQIAIYQAVRGSGDLWGAVNVGRNNARPNGSNYWTITPDPNGPDDQAYLVGKAKTPVRDGIDALIMLAPNDGTPGKPGEPTDVRATVMGGGRIDLQWVDNAFNETGFVIEQKTGGTYREIATVGANVTRYSVTNLDSTVNQSFRVRARNAVGDSRDGYVWIYSGWTETNFQNPADLPLYHYYQCSDLRPARAGGPDHVAVNNDSAHGQTLTVDVDAIAVPGLYIYFFYQDKDNWYRLSYGVGSCSFEKRVGGTTSQIGDEANNRTDAHGSLRPWRLEVTPAGTLKFLDDGVTLLSVNDRLGFQGGKIGLGGAGADAVWENFRFDASGGGGTSPAMAPANLVAKSGQSVNLTWEASAGAVSYNVYRSPRSNGQSAVPIATGITGTNHSDTGVDHGTTYFYKVRAVNAFGVSADSNEALGLPFSEDGHAPTAPAGLAATAHDTEVYLTWAAGTGAASYSLYRGTRSNGEDALPIATGISRTDYMDSGLKNDTAYFYKLRAVNASGISGDSNEAAATPSERGNGPGFANAGFETPSFNGYTLDPVGTGWTFANNAGIQHNGSAYGAVNAPGGTQTALLQGVNGKLGEMSQTISLSAGTYAIGFHAAVRYNVPQPVRVTVDGKVVGDYAPASNRFEHITTAPFTQTATGPCTVTFAATDKSGDRTIFIDLVTVNAVRGGSDAKGPPPR